MTFAKTVIFNYQSNFQILMKDGEDNLAARQNPPVNIPGMKTSGKCCLKLSLLESNKWLYLLSCSLQYSVLQVTKET